MLRVLLSDIIDHNSTSGSRSQVVTWKFWQVYVNTGDGFAFLKDWDLWLVFSYRCMCVDIINVKQNECWKFLNDKSQVKLENEQHVDAKYHLSV